jgi:cytochrome c oxidase accessory protein FixG
VTSIAGRVFCGYFCFQTVWTEVFTFIEGKLEGDTPLKRAKFLAVPWSIQKVIQKLLKHVLWLVIAVLTGITFSAWFTDAYQLWPAILQLQAPIPVWVAMATFTIFTYAFAGFMREQVCFWLCPYARLQGVMYDQDTVLPAYDAERGEPRGKLSQQSAASQGACIDCNVCVAVCPTGIDIRKGQQEGCITCGLCIDACDNIMDKINRPRGLIRYASYKELYLDKVTIPLLKRPRTVIYGLIMLLCVGGIIRGLSQLAPTEFYVKQERRPLYTQMSNGDIQNKYTLKLLNKTSQTLNIQYTVSGLEGAIVSGLDQSFTVEPGKSVPVTALVRYSGLTNSDIKLHDITFTATAVNVEGIQDTYESVFITP